MWLDTNILKMHTKGVPTFLKNLKKLKKEKQKRTNDIDTLYLRDLKEFISGTHWIHSEIKKKQ